MPKIVVIGDVIVDSYWYGDAKRISPEAPVPVLLRNSDEQIRLGGACNVALNIASLGAEVELIGVVGNDENGKSTKEILNNAGIKSNLITQSQNKTIKKMRILSRNQQLLRLDSEEVIMEKESKKVINLVKSSVKKNDIFVFSDYGKGTLFYIKDLINIVHEAKKMILVDPKGKDFSKYKNADIITPNKSEFKQIVGTWKNQIELNKKATKLLKNLNLKSLIITKGAEGLSIYNDSNSESFDIPSKAREVYDVTGAGDTFIGALAYYLGMNYCLKEAAKISNIAAGIIVSKAGTAIINKNELEKALENDLNNKKSKKNGVTVIENLLSEIKFSRRRGKKIVFTNGVFDILHKGHIRYLQKAKEFGDILIVAVNDDNSVRKLNKGKGRPINSLIDRMEVLSALSSIDWVLSFREENPERLIKLLKPDFLIKGGDYKISDIAGSEFVREYGGIVKTINFEKGYSTSSMIEKIIQNS